MPLSKVRNQIWRGTAGRVWVNDAELAQVKKLEAKLTLNYEEVDTNGNFVSQHVYSKCSVAGTISMFKINSFMLSTIAAEANSGVAPDITIIAKVTDPNITGSQRVKLTGVQFTEINLALFENGTITEEDLPFTADGYEILETVA